MVVVAQTIPAEADADCAGLIDEVSMTIGGWGLWDADAMHLQGFIRNPTSRFVNS
jgi:hypothetical protein